MRTKDNYKKNSKNNNWGNGGNGRKMSGRRKLVSVIVFVFLVLVLSLFIDKFSDRLPFKLPWRDGAPIIEISQVIGMDIPAFEGSPYVIIDNNTPNEFDGAYNRKDFTVGVHYSELDDKGRAGVAWGVLDSSLMPSENRVETLETKPSGWNPAKYDDIIEDGFLYNRCHLIGFQLTGENDNALNLMTGTRFFNIEGMLPFENRVAGYIRREDGKVFYRVTPLFQGDELLARYVRMEGFSLDDKGAAVCFDVLVYNVQPGIVIDYATGASHREK